MTKAWTKILLACHMKSGFMWEVNFLSVQVASYGQLSLIAAFCREEGAHLRVHRGFLSENVCWELWEEVLFLYMRDASAWVTCRGCSPWPWLPPGTLAFPMLCHLCTLPLHENTGHTFQGHSLPKFLSVLRWNSKISLIPNPSRTTLSFESSLS